MVSTKYSPEVDPINGEELPVRKDLRINLEADEHSFFRESGSAIQVGHLPTLHGEGQEKHGVSIGPDKESLQE